MSTKHKLSRSEQLLGMLLTSKPVKAHLKSERVQDTERIQRDLQAVPEWQLGDDGHAIHRVKEFETSAAAEAFASFVGRLATVKRQPVNIALAGKLVGVTLTGYPPKGVRRWAHPRRFQTGRHDRLSHYERRCVMATPFTQGMSQGDFQKKCEVMLTGAKANPDPSIQEFVFGFEVALEGAKESQSRRALHRYQGQQASRDYDGFLVTLNDLYSRLRRFYQAMFGTRAEKLAEFGLLPLRPAQKAKPNPQSPEQKPPEQGQKPTQADTPATGEVN